MEIAASSFFFLFQNVRRKCGKGTRRSQNVFSFTQVNTPCGARQNQVNGDQAKRFKKRRGEQVESGTKYTPIITLIFIKKYIFAHALSILLALLIESNLICPLCNNPPPQVLTAFEFEEVLMRNGFFFNRPHLTSGTCLKSTVKTTRNLLDYFHL